MLLHFGLLLGFLTITYPISLPPQEVVISNASGFQDIFEHSITHKLLTE